MTNQNESLSNKTTKQKGAVKMDQNNMITMVHYMQTRENGKWITIEGYEPMTITLDQFIKSFVNERWFNERRYNKQYTKLGYYHTKTITKRDDNYRSVREFKFPD